MKHLKMYGSHESYTKEELAELEKTVGATLPEEYARFIAAYNGGFPSLRCFNHFENESPDTVTDSVQEFFFIGDPNDFSSINYHVRMYAKYEPEGLLPIAWNGEGVKIYISLKGDDRGYVYLIVHWIDPSDGNIFLASKSFSEFLDSLYDCSELDDDERDEA